MAKLLASMALCHSSAIVALRIAAIAALHFHIAERICLLLAAAAIFLKILEHALELSYDTCPTSKVGLNGFPG